jgi:hypothetical protein
MGRKGKRNLSGGMFKADAPPRERINVWRFGKLVEGIRRI